MKKERDRTRACTSAKSQLILLDENVCKDMITAYVDGCSFHHETQVRAGVGVVWGHDMLYEPQWFNLGSQSFPIC